MKLGELEMNVNLCKAHETSVSQPMQAWTKCLTVCYWSEGRTDLPALQPCWMNTYHQTARAWSALRKVTMQLKKGVSYMEIPLWKWPFIIFNYT